MYINYPKKQSSPLKSRVNNCLRPITNLQHKHQKPRKGRRCLCLCYKFMMYRPIFASGKNVSRGLYCIVLEYNVKKNSCSIDARPASAGGVQIGDRERSSLARSLARGIRTAVFIIYNCIYIIVRGSSQLGSTPSAWLSSYSRRVPQQNAYSRSSRRSWTRALRVCFLTCFSSGSSSDAVESSGYY